MYEQIKDLRLSFDGDLVESGGDLLLTDGLDWYQREVNKRVRSGPDWYHHPRLGANLGSFLGQPNNRETGRRIRDRVVQSVTAGGIHIPAKVEVEVVPTDFHELEVIVILVHEGVRTVVSQEIIRFDRGTVETIADPTPTQSAIPPASPYQDNTNKYIDRIRRQ
jgi:hypothetical protein